jgi:uncharacterized protein
MSNKIEHRSFKTELRVAADKPQVSGYAAVYNAPTDLGFGYRETISPLAFVRALQEKQDIRCLLNHDANHVLGRTKSGTLRVSSDNTGLYFECDLSDSVAAQNVRTMILRGDVDQCSFAFSCVHDDTRYNDDGTIDRELLDVDLYDVSPVTYPAYDSTSCEARSVIEARAFAEAQRKLETGKTLTKDELETLRLRVQLHARMSEDCQCGCIPCENGLCPDCSDPDCDDVNCRCQM